MPSLVDVYSKFGEVAEAAQLLETQLGNLLIEVSIGAHDSEIIDVKSFSRALFEDVDRRTLGQLIKLLRKSKQFEHTLESELATALTDRNRLSHSFYRDHNFRRKTADGRAIMLADLDAIHARVLDAYVDVLKLSGIDLAAAKVFGMPTEHLELHAKARQD
jgi:hypothetical protein